MMWYDLHLDRAGRRMHFRGSGIWDVEISHHFVKDMKSIREWALTGGKPISILSDLSGLSVHSQEVSTIVGGGANQLRDMPLDRYAMIVPSFLMRMQVRRIDPFPQRRLFQSVADALDWLEWGDLMPSEGWNHAPAEWVDGGGWGCPDTLVSGAHDRMG